MPHLRFRGADLASIQVVASAILDQMEAVVKAPRDWFTLEVVGSTYVFDGNEGARGVMVEYFWFDRGVSVRDQVAEAITTSLRTVYPEGDITVIFHALAPDHYYENGKRLG